MISADHCLALSISPPPNGQLGICQQSRVPSSTSHAAVVKNAKKFMSDVKDGCQIATVAQLNRKRRSVDISACHCSDDSHAGVMHTTFILCCNM